MELREKKEFRTRDSLITIMSKIWKNLKVPEDDVL
jgi:hypothetical protein